MKQLAVATSLLVLSAASHSQGSVTVTGVIDAYAASMKLAGAPSRIATVGSGGMTTSYFGFTGWEELGDGFRATFALTSFLRADTGSSGRFDGDPFWARDANVGVSGPFGAVQLGRAAAPNFVPSVLVNPFGNSFTFSPLILAQNVNSTKWTYRTTPSDTGWSNQLVYATPNLAGLRAAVQYQAGEQATDGRRGKHNLGGNLIYQSAPVTAVASYERDQITNPVSSDVIGVTVVGVLTPTTRTVWMVGGAYDAGVAKGFATYGESKTELTGYRAKTVSLGVSAPLTADRSGLLLGGVARTRVTGPFEGTRTTASLGYDHYLSKRTDLYVVGMNDRVTAASSGTSFGVGVRHRF